MGSGEEQPVDRDGRFVRLTFCKSPILSTAEANVAKHYRPVRQDRGKARMHSCATLEPHQRAFSQ